MRLVPFALAPMVLASACRGDGLDPFGPDPLPQPQADGPSRFTVAYRHDPAGEITASIGVWMHREPAFSREGIADWLEQPFEGKELLEPINVLWVDLAAGSETEARDNVVEFLDECGFDRAGNVFFGLIPRHSSGYYASYGPGVWREQYDPDDAWVDRLGVLGLDSNHGRIFPAFELLRGGRRAYFTSGAFSQEGPRGTLDLGVECLFRRERCHPYRSFNEARDSLDCGAPGWGVASHLLNFGNSVPVSAGLSYSTGDHDGVLVFERSAPGAKLVP